MILGYNRTSKPTMFAKLLNSKLSKTFPEETKHCNSFINLTFYRKKTGRYTSMAPPPIGTKSHFRCYSTLTRSLKRCFTPLNKAHLVGFGKDESKVRFLSRHLPAKIPTYSHVLTMSNNLSSIYVIYFPSPNYSPSPLRIEPCPAATM